MIWVINIISLITLSALAVDPRPVDHSAWNIPNYNRQISRRHGNRSLNQNASAIQSAHSMQIASTHPYSYGHWNQTYAPARFIKVHLTNAIEPLTSVDFRNGLDTLGIVYGDDTMTGGSGIVISSDNHEFSIVLTAAHNFIDDKCKLETTKATYYFSAGHSQPYSENAAPITDIVVGDRCAGFRPLDYSKDWAIAIVSHKFSSSTALPTISFNLSVKEFKQEFPTAKLRAAAYHEDQRSFVKTAPCKLRPDSDNTTFVHNCSATYGWSGGPLFMEWQNKYHLIGLVITGLRNNRNWNRAVRLHNDLITAVELIRKNGRSAFEGFGKRHIRLSQ